MQGERRDEQMAETGPPDPEEVRRQLIALVRQKGKRKHQWSKEYSTDWRPNEVHDDWGAMTPARGWELILQWLENRRPIETKEMTLNSGKSIWVHVMVEQLGDQMIYVKLEILAGGEV